MMMNLTRFATIKLAATVIGAGVAAGLAMKKGVELLNPMKNINAIKEAVASSDDFDEFDDDDDEDVIAMMNSQNSAEASDPEA